MISEPPRSTPSSASQRRALGVFALGAVAALIALAAPVSSGLFLGTLLAFSLLNSYERLLRRWNRPALVAALLSSASGVAMLVIPFGILYFVVVRGAAAAQQITVGVIPVNDLQEASHRLMEATAKLPGGPIDLTKRVVDYAQEAQRVLERAIGVVASVTASGSLTLFFTVMTTYFVLRHWPELQERAERMLPLHPKHTRVVMFEFQKVGKEVFIGTMLTGLAQGVLAGIGYGIGGVPEAMLLATLTAICSLVPVVGTMLIWVPVGVVLILSGHPGAGIFQLLWGGLVVVGLSDYVIRPTLVGGHGHVPTLLTFISLFGGVEVFGLMGLIIGPVIASVALALLRTYDREICAG